MSSPRLGSGFTDEELKMFTPSYSEEEWSRQKRQVIEAAHKKTIERNEYKKENWNLQQRVTALEKEKELLELRVIALDKENGDLKANGPYKLEEPQRLASPKSYGEEQSPVCDQQIVAKASTQIVFKQLLDENDTLRQQLQAASNVDISVAEDEFVARKLAELTTCRKSCAELRETLLATENAKECLLTENTALKAQLQHAMDKEKEKSHNPSRINTPSRMLWAHNPSPSIGIGSLQEFPTLPCGPLHKSASRSTLTDGSTSVDSASAEMLLKGFERLENVVLKCVKMQKGFHPIADASPTAIKAQRTEWGIETSPPQDPVAVDHVEEPKKPEASPEADAVAPAAPDTSSAHHEAVEVA